MATQCFIILSAAIIALFGAVEAHREGTVVRSFHMGPHEVPPDQNLSGTPCEECWGCSACCNGCHPVYPGCCGAPFFDESDDLELYDQNATWPGKTESSWMHELKR